MYNDYQIVYGAQLIPTTTERTVTDNLEEGDECPNRAEQECMGYLTLEMSRCYCNADTAPCHYCTLGVLECNECGWEI